MSSSAIPTGGGQYQHQYQHQHQHQHQHDHHRQSWQPHSHSFGTAAAAMPSSIPSTSPHPALFHNPAGIPPQQHESLDWEPAYDSFLVLDVEATCMDIPRGTSFHHGPSSTTNPPPPPLSSSASSSSHHRLSVSHASPGNHNGLSPGSYPHPGSYTSNGTPTTNPQNNGLHSPGLFPMPTSPLLSPLSSISPLPLVSSSPSPSPSASGSTFGRTALVDYPNEIIEFPVILMQWRDVPPEQGGRPGQRTLEVVDEFHSWVRPAWRPRLSRFCKDLTGVRQNVIDSAPSWPEVMQNFLEFLRKHNLLADNNNYYQPSRARSSSIASSNASGSSPLPFGAFSPASPPMFPMLSSPASSSHHLSHLHHAQQQQQHHGSFNHFSHAQQGQQSQQASSLSSSSSKQRQLSPGPGPGPGPAQTQAVEWESQLSMTTPLRRGVAWCTHGPYDLRDFVLKSCHLSGLRTPPCPPYWLRGPLIDIRKCAAEILLEERMLRLRTGDAREFAARECRKAKLARAMECEMPGLNAAAARKGRGKGKGKDKSQTTAATATATAAEEAGTGTGAEGDQDDQEWKRELELDHLLQSYERSMRAWPWYSAAISGHSNRFTSASAAHSVAHSERVKILPDGTIDGILYSLGLGLFKGRKHSGLDDSRNLGRILGDMARRVGEVATGRGTPGWEVAGRTVVDVDGRVGKKGRVGGKRRGRRKRGRGRGALVENGGVHDDDVGELDEGVAHLDLGSPLSSAADLDGDEDGDSSSGSSLEDSDDDGGGAPGEEDAHDGWIGVDGDADIDTSAPSATGHSFVTSYNDSERRRLCALQGQVFERACLLPNSFWKPLYLPTTVFSPVAATAARLLIWGTGPENRGGGLHSHSHSHQGQHGRGGGGRNAGGGNAQANSSLSSSMMENTGPPVPARPIWMEGRRHAWMGHQPGQVFWNGPSIVDDCDDGHSSDEEEEDEDEVFRYPGGGSPEDALDRTVLDLRKVGNPNPGGSGGGSGEQRRGSGSGSGSARVLGTPKVGGGGEEGEGDSEVFTYTSSSSSSSASSAKTKVKVPVNGKGEKEKRVEELVDEAVLLDDVDIGNTSYSRPSSSRGRESSPASSSSSPSRSGSSRVRRGVRSSLDEDHDHDEDEEEEGDLTLTSRAIPIPIPGTGGGGMPKGTTSTATAAASSRRGSGGGGARASQHEQRRAEGQAGGVQTPTRRPSAGAGAGGGGKQTPSGQQTPVVGSSSSSTTTPMRA